MGADLKNKEADDKDKIFKNKISNMNEEDLNNLKYRQLQKLAKEHGIKANLPKNAIIAAILEANSTEKDIVETSEKIDVSKNDSVDSLSSTANETTKNESKEESEEKVIEAVEDE